ncbi:uncharacterized protein LOC143914366 isoform X2 [Arctopsyche grandis]|uniref:uncharacterized protein LOC143914366 isoform X2 n=1 Tax=Arctopsyche grandis TaxID=121162 RepID=UPI00406D692F
MVKFAKFCCFNLRHWTLLISSVGLVYSIMDSFIFINDDDHDDDENERIEKSSYSKKMEIIGFTFSVAGVIVNAITVYAAIKSKRLLLIPWLMTVLLLLFFNEIPLYANDFDAVDYSLTFLKTGLLLLMWLIIFCFYQNIKEEEFLSMQRRLRVQTQHVQPLGALTMVGMLSPEQV